jgi:hypothetical protein
MIDLAISIDSDTRGTTVIETNRGAQLRAPRWPQDCDFQLVVFRPSGKTCEVIWIEQLAEDIANALMMLDEAKAVKAVKPDWYRRLSRCANGAAKAKSQSERA